jgi:coniferyl-aldehyde dehydrogenase
VTIGTTIETDDGLAATLVRQRAAFLRDGPPPLAERRSDLMRLKNALRAHREDFVATINTDFGHRSRQETLLFDLASVVEGINFLHRNLRRWMQPERRRVALPFRPASNRVLYQPLDVVGIISPWNYPVALALMPLATALAAGNRAMIKPSELTPQTSALMKSVLGQVFAEDQVG